MAILITVAKDIKVTQVVAANAVPPVGLEWTTMSDERRKEVLLEQLDLSGLEGCPEANQVTAQALLAECNAFSCGTKRTRLY